MTTLSVTTLYLAEAIGLYLLLVGLAALVAPQRWQAIMDDLAASPGLQITMGVLVFAIGIAIAITHSRLTDPLAIIVSAVGWIALLEGALLIAVPGPLLRIGHWSMRFIRIWGIVALVLGVLLALAGLTGKVGLPDHLYV